MPFFPVQPSAQFKMPSKPTKSPKKVKPSGHKSMPVAIYCRTATVEPNARASAQLKHCMAEIRKRKRVGWEHHQTLSDWGHSGNTLDRPNLQRLLAMARQGAIGAVVVHDLTRLARDLRLTFKILALLHQHHVRVYSVINGMDAFEGRCSRGGPFLGRRGILSVSAPTPS